MSNISGNGTPTRKTVGAIGDLYLDQTNGRKYECIFAYSDGGEWNTQWKEVGTDDILEKKIDEPILRVEAKKFPEVKIEKTFDENNVDLTEKPEEEPESVSVAVEELTPAPTPAPSRVEQIQNRQKTNYNKFSGEKR